MLPKWKQRKYILVLLFWVLSLYDVNEREVWSMALNDNIKKFREEKNLTQQQLADKLYVSRQTVCRWENGSRCPDLITAKQLPLILQIRNDADNVSTTYAISHYIFEIFTPFSFNLYSKFTPF